MEWQPIETAPKDGLPFIAWGVGELWWEKPVYDIAGGICDVDQHNQSFIGWHECFYWKETNELCAPPDMSFGLNGYAIHKYNDGTTKQIDTPDDWTHRLTHWMRPEPPK